MDAYHKAVNSDEQSLRAKTTKTTTFAKYTVCVTSNISEDSLKFTKTKRFQFEGKDGFPLSSNFYVRAHARKFLLRK